MNPLKYAQSLKWLTRDKSLEKLYKEGKLFPASEAPIPTKKPEVEGMEAINRFVKDNPRIEQPKEGVIQSAYDTATREAQMGNYPAPKYETFRARYLRNLNKKEDGGMLVKPSADGSRPGYSSDYVNLGDIKKYNKNLLNKSIVVSDSVKAGANQAERVSLQNVFDVVGRTQGGDELIKNFKKNPNEENFLKLKRRRKNRLAFEREQALPPAEKAELRKKQKIAEQKWRNSKKGLNFYNNYLSQSGIFPARTPEERIWRDIYRASKQKKGESRFIIKFPKNTVDKKTGLPKTVESKLTGKQYIPWDTFYKNITFYDTVSKKNIKFNTVKQWMTNNIQNGAQKYDNTLQNYKISNAINTFEVEGKALSKFAKDKQKNVFGKRLATASAVNHRSGLDNFWDTEVTTASGNKFLNEKVQANIQAYKKASNPNIKKQILKNMKQNIKTIEGGATLVLDDKTTIGKPPTTKSVISALEKEYDIKVDKKKLSNILNAFCKPGRSRLSNGTNPDGLTCSMEEVQRGIQKETEKAKRVSKDGRIPKKFGKLRALGTTLFGVADPAIEFMFAAPYLVAGDIEGAKAATTAGLFGAGKRDIENMSDKEAQRYVKHIRATEDWMSNYFTSLETENQLKNLQRNTGAFELATKQLNQAKQNMENIADDYGKFGYSFKGADTPLSGKVAMQKYIRDEVAKDFDEKVDKGASTQFFKDSDPNLLRENIRSLGGDPKTVSPIVDLESYMANRGEPMAGNENILFNVKPYVLDRARSYGLPDLFDDYAAGAGVEKPGFMQQYKDEQGETQYDIDMGRKSLQDAYSEIPLEFANQLSALEKKQLEEGLLQRRLTGFAGGGIAGLSGGVKSGPAPESGKTPHGLLSIKNNVKKY